MNQTTTHAFAIYLQQQLIGNIALQQVGSCGTYSDNTHDTEVGYWLVESHQGQGIISQCISRIIDYAFSKLQLPALYLHCTMDNTKSRRIAQKFGFTFVRLLPMTKQLDRGMLEMQQFILTKQQWLNYNQKLTGTFKP